MTDSPLSQEKRFLSYSAIGNVVLGVVGITFAALTGSQAILLDGVFNLTYFAMALFTIRVAGYVVSGDDETFPFGYAFFEPLVNGIKGTLVLGVSVMALVGAVQALLSGGREIEAGPAIAYGVFASAAGWVLATSMRKGAAATKSPLVRADADNWVVNAAVSSCVVLAFAGIFVLRAAGRTGLVPYVDPAVVLTIVLLSLGVPVRMAWGALMALLNRAPSQSIVNRVTALLDESLSELPVQERFVRVIEPGRARLVQAHVVLPPGFPVGGLPQLDAVRDRAYDALSRDHEGTYLDILFTSDRKWGAPSSDGGQGALPS